MVSNAIGKFEVSGTATPLTPFNLLDLTDYNLWYSAIEGKTTILVSNFIFQVAKTTPSATPTLVTEIKDKAINNYARLCFASTLSTKNVIKI
jgi:hypothetical protein